MVWSSSSILNTAVTTVGELFLLLTTLYWLAGMGTQKNVPKKQKVKLLTVTCLFVKRKFNETHKDFSINYPYNNKFRIMIFSF